MDNRFFDVKFTIDPKERQWNSDFFDVTHGRVGSICGKIKNEG